MISGEIVHARIDIIEENLKLLREVAAEGFSSFSKNYRDIQAVKHSLQEAVEACLDMGNYIIAEKGFRRAEDYSEVFKVLEEEGLIAPELSNRLQEMAKFRNLLVHRYGEIELKRLFIFIKEDLGDIERYVTKILEFLDSQTE